MPKPAFARPRHQTVVKILGLLNASFLERVHCYFGGGTRIALGLNEFRESADIELLCSSRDGYRELRGAIGSNTLGEIASGKLPLAREVVADRYGIRTFIAMDGEKIKFEIVNEGRIELSGGGVPGLPVPCLDEVSCFAEKLLANADRWNDESFLCRDIIDLAFMVEAWGTHRYGEGAACARTAYGETIDRAAHLAAKKLIDDKTYLKHCVDRMQIRDGKTLAAGLKRLAKGSG